MNNQVRMAFDGRVIMDHLPKTGGTSLTNWLRASLGNRVVSDALIGRHNSIITKYGGAFSILSGHLFFNGEGFDPWYRYVTWLREPVERALSFIFFVLNNHDREKLPGVWDRVDR